MDYSSALINACASALGGSATALIVIGFFGKYLFDNWFKKDYKKWELEREKIYKEDFKRFENKLDVMATKDETLFETLHPERFKVAAELFARATTIYRDYDNQLYTEVYLDMVTDEQQLAAIMEIQRKIMQGGLSLRNYISERSYLFNADLVKLITDFVDAAMSQSHVAEFRKRSDIGIDAARKPVEVPYYALEGALKSLLGVTNEKEEAVSA